MSSRVQEIDKTVSKIEEERARLLDEMIALKLERASIECDFRTGFVLYNRRKDRKAIVSSGRWTVSPNGNTFSIPVRYFKKNGEPYKNESWLHYWDIKNWEIQYAN